MASCMRVRWLTDGGHCGDYFGMERAAAPGVPRIETKTDAYHVRNVVLRKRSGSVRETNNHGDGDRKYNYSFFAVSTGCQRFCQRRIAHVVSDRTSVTVAFFYCFFCDAWDWD